MFTLYQTISKCSIKNELFYKKINSMLDSRCLILEKSFTAENPPNGVAGKRGGFLATKASAFAKATADRLRHKEKLDSPWDSLRRITGFFLPRRAQRFLAGLVFLAKPAFKASFVAGYCRRPLGHQGWPA